jgi:peptide/nickel transport system substrate-binding protein
MKTEEYKMRKTNMIFSLLLVAVFIVTSCSPAQTPVATMEQPTVEEPTATSAAIEVKEATPTTVVVETTKYKEAPMLADKVAKGELPPVEERISGNPLVTEVVDAIGKYGGVLNVKSGGIGWGDIQMYISEPPIKYKPDLAGYEAAAVESYEWSEDGKTFTIHMRKDMRWSDGEPYTSEDWRFWWEDLALNEDYKVVSVPSWLRNTDKTPITMEFPDDYTVVWKAKDRALWIDPYYMAQGFWEFAGPMMKPAHYLKQYHPKYATDKTYDDLAKIDSWATTPGYPCLFAWCYKGPIKENEVYAFERNPYYYRVDTEGNQLPYIDTIQIHIVSDAQAGLLACTQGKFDVAVRECGGTGDIPLLEEKAASGGYHLMKGWKAGWGAFPNYLVNQYYVEGGGNYPNDTPEMPAQIRALLRNKDFRQALAYGVDRQRIMDVAFNGSGVLSQNLISPQSWHFAGTEGQAVFKKWLTTYTEFDVEKANTLLDGIGMIDKNGDGWRDLPNTGDDFTLLIEFGGWGGSEVQAASAPEMKIQYEENLKIKVNVVNVGGTPKEWTTYQNGFSMLYAAGSADVDIWTFPDWVFGIRGATFMGLEGRYFMKGGEACTDQPTEGNQFPCGVEPEPGSPAAKLQEIYVKGQNTKSAEERHKLIWEAIQVHLDEGPFAIGISGDQPWPVLVKDYVRNVLDFGVTGPWAPSTPGNGNPCQWWIDQ